MELQAARKASFEAEQRADLVRQELTQALDRLSAAETENAEHVLASGRHKRETARAEGLLQEARERTAELEGRVAELQATTKEMDAAEQREAGSSSML